MIAAARAVTLRWQRKQIEQFDPWMALVLSLITPGAGHLLALRWTGMAWLVADGLLLRAVAAVPESWQVGATLLQLVVWLVMGLLAGEQLATVGIPKLAPSALRRSAAASRIVAEPRRRRAIAIRLEVDIACPISAAWAQVSDLERFHAVDPFHVGVTPAGGRWTPGAFLAIHHQALGMRWIRTGRLLSWHEGHGYAFSDLSPLGPRVGFPHVFFVSVAPLAAGRSRVTIAVRGRWNQRWIAPWLGMVWVRFVMSRHARLLRFALS